MRFPLRLITIILLSLLAMPASAQERETPYWATLRSDEVNMRAGPSEDYQINWVYRRAGLPMKVVRLRQGWRLVRDPDGAPADNGRLLWNAEPGVVGKLGDCEAGWCEFDAGNRRKGWIQQSRLWGAGDP